MAMVDKTYYNREGRMELTDVRRIAEKLAISEEDVFDAMDQVGANENELMEFFHCKENSY